MADPKKLSIDAALQVEGSEDTTQLEVRGVVDQTAPLQEWQDAGGDAVARATGDGRVQVGDADLDTSDALIEANEAISLPTDRPLRGIQSLGQIGGAIVDAITWALHELHLLGTGGVTGLHVALRAVLRLDNSGGASGAEVRAGDFEAINASNPVAKVVGVSSAITNETGGAITEAAAFSVAPPINQGGSGAIDTLIGLDVPDLDKADANFAIRTGKGQVHLGDFLEIEQVDAAPDGAPGVVRIYPKDNGKLYAKAPGGDEYDLTATGSGGGGASMLDDLTDVSITGAAQGDLLSRTASNWTNVHVSDETLVARIGGSNVAGLSIPASTIVGRKATGSITALTAGEVKTLLALLHGELGGIGPDNHHDQIHTMADHTGTGSAAELTDTTASAGTGTLPARIDHTHKKAINVRHGAGATVTHPRIRFNDGLGTIVNVSEDAGAADETIISVDVTASSTSSSDNILGIFGIGGYA